MGNKGGEIVRILVVNPKYDLKESYKKFMAGNFPGQALYGINYLSKMCTSTGELIELVWQEEQDKIMDIKNRILCELKLGIGIVRSQKNIDAIYLPHLGYGGMAVGLFKRLGILKKPCVSLVHRYDNSSHIKKFYLQ